MSVYFAKNKSKIGISNIRVFFCRNFAAVSLGNFNKAAASLPYPRHRLMCSLYRCCAKLNEITQQLYFKFYYCTYRNAYELQKQRK